MSVAVLTEVYDEVRRLAIAGSVVAPGDFRLQKLVKPLEKAGEKAPVFAKVAVSVQKLIDSNEKSSAEALLEVSTLVNAILYTQGETGSQGKLAAIPTENVSGHHTRTSAQILKPLLEALTTTGSGRLEMIRDAHERGAFSDLRLVKPAIGALDDSYPGVGEYVAEKILPMYGQAILPDLKAKLDIKGKGGQVRRLTLMHKLDPEGTGPLVKEALENGSKEMKVAAIECLGMWPESLQSLLTPLNYLLEQVTAKAKDVREAALAALAQLDDKEALAAIETALKGNDVALAIRPIRVSSNPKLLQCALQEADAQFTTIVSGKEKDKKVLGKQVDRMLTLLECVRGKKDKPAEAFLHKCFDAREKLASIKAEPSGLDIVLRLIELMSVATARTQNALVDARDTLPPENLHDAFVAAQATRKPAEVFKLFSPYLMAKVDEKKKQRDPAYVRRSAIIEALTDWDYRWDVKRASDEKNLDARWLDLAVEQGNLDLVYSLARPGHKATLQLLEKAFGESLKKSKDWSDSHHILAAMVRVQHPAATPSLVALLEKQAKSTHHYAVYWIARLIPDLPKEAVAPLEELLPKLPDKVVDQVLGYVTELKLKS